MIRTNRLTERDLSRIVRRVINEDKQEKRGSVGNCLNDFIDSFEFSQKGNDELIEFTHKLLDGNLSDEEFENFKSYFDGYELEFFKLISDPNRGVNSIAEQIFKRLKQGTGSDRETITFATNQEDLGRLRDRVKFR
jgi:hypothetical protein